MATLSLARALAPTLFGEEEKEENLEAGSGQLGDVYYWRSWSPGIWGT
jgi:hypothetical protein